MVKWALFFLFCLFSFLGIYLFFYLGAYKNVTVNEVDYPTFHIVYKEHQGEYHKILTTIQDVENWAKKNNIRCPQTFGRYLDAPDSGPGDRLRSHGGCVLKTAITEPPKPYVYEKIESKKYIYSSFDGAPSIGPWKVYSKVYNYAEEKRIKLVQAVIEIYTVYTENKMKTEYLFEID